MENELWSRDKRIVFGQQEADLLRMRNDNVPFSPDMCVPTIDKQNSYCLQITRDDDDDAWFFFLFRQTKYGNNQ